MEDRLFLISIANTQPPGLPYPMPPSENTNASATYTYSPTGLLSSETATTQTSPPSCLPPTPPAHPTPPSQKPCSTTSTTSFSWNTVSSIPEMIGVNGYAYIYTGGLPTEQIGPNGSVLYYLEDRQGSTVALTDQQGNVVARYSYSPYGTLTCGPNTPPNTQPNQPLCHPAPPTPPAACPPPSQHSPAGPPPCLSKAIAANHFLYDGQYLDTISGLYYLRARWYDPATGQFSSVDALVALTGEPYQYANEDPVNNTDPLGLTTEGLCLSAQAYIVDEGGNVQVCIVEANGNQQVGITVTGGSYVTESTSNIDWVSGLVANILHLAAIGASLTYERTTANRISQLAGPFTYLSGSALYFTGSYFQNAYGSVKGVDIGGTLGLLPVNGEAGTTCTITKTYSPGSQMYSEIVQGINLFTQNPLSYPIRLAAQGLLNAL